MLDRSGLKNMQFGTTIIQNGWQEAELRPLFGWVVKHPRVYPQYCGCAVCGIPRPTPGILGWGVMRVRGGVPGVGGAP